jgi:DNA primase
MALPEYFKQELKSRCQIQDIVSSYVNLKRSGKNLMGLCPFHNEKTPSFCVYPENGSFYCFGCHTGGDVITFIQHIERLDYLEAVKFLAQRAGLTVPEDGVDDSVSRLRTRILEINRESARFFYHCLSKPEGKAGLSYLLGRGLDPGTIKRFGLGYAPDSGFALVNWLRGKGYQPQEMVQADVARISKNGNAYDRYRGRVMFPIFDLRGNVVAFGGRILTDEKPKYINTMDTLVYHKSSGLFAMNLAKDTGSKQLILAEGYMDVIALHRAGFTNTIASLGTSLTAEQANIMRRYAEEAVICYDSDAAGQRATQRAIPILKNAGLSVKVVTVPGNKDPDEFFRHWGAEGPVRFQKLLEQSGNDVEYQLDKLKSQFSLETDDGKVKYLQEGSQVISKVLNPLERDVYAGRLAQECGVSKESILSFAAQAAAKERRHRRREEIRSQQQILGMKSQVNPEKQNHPRTAFAEENVIAYLFDHPDRSEALQVLLPVGNMVTTWNKKLYQALLEKTKNGAVSISDFSGALNENEMSELTRIVVQHRDAPPDWEDVKKSIDVINSDPNRLQNASEEETKAYFERLRKQKIGGTDDGTTG